MIVENKHKELDKIKRYQTPASLILFEASYSLNFKRFLIGSDARTFRSCFFLSETLIFELLPQAGLRARMSCSVRFLGEAPAADRALEGLELEVFADVVMHVIDPAGLEQAQPTLYRRVVSLGQRVPLSDTSIVLGERRVIFVVETKLAGPHSKVGLLSA